jgi:hypothetical protein
MVWSRDTILYCRHFPREADSFEHTGALLSGQQLLPWAALLFAVALIPLTLSAMDIEKEVLTLAFL